MKQLLRKEWREQFKFALLCLAIFTVMLSMDVREALSQHRDLQPLLYGSLLTQAVFFCAIFGAVLGWRQIQAEQHPDLRTFLIHRPVPRSTLLLGKLLSGLFLYLTGAGLPLAGLAMYASIPGSVPAPFEWAMVLPATNIFLLGLGFYAAGLLAGVRSVRWFGSRCFGIGLPVLATFCYFSIPTCGWELLVILISGAVLLLAVWGAFQTGGFYRHQSLPGKMSLVIACTGAGVILCGLAAVLLHAVIAIDPAPGAQYKSYQITRQGMVAEVGSGNSIIVDSNNVSSVEESAGSQGKVYFAPATGFTIFGNSSGLRSVQSRYHDPNSYFIPLRIDHQSAWYLTRNGRLLVYDLHTRRLAASLEPGTLSAQDSSAHVQFNWPPTYGSFNLKHHPQFLLLASNQTIYRVDADKRTTSPFFTTATHDEINGFGGSEDQGFAIATRNAIHLLNLEGQTEWTVPNQPDQSNYLGIEVYPLDTTNQFVLKFDPSRRPLNRSGETLLTQIKWITSDGTLIRSRALPALPEPMYNDPVGNACLLVFPPTLRLVAEYSADRSHVLGQWDAFSCIPLPFCILIGWVMGRRFHFSFTEQLGWAIFHALLGIPGVLAFFSVQEWPAKEPCPQCQKWRMVDREHCEHCGADFAPPARNGTEIFAPPVAAENSTLVEK